MDYEDAFVPALDEATHVEIDRAEPLKPTKVMLQFHRSFSRSSLSIRPLAFSRRGSAKLGTTCREGGAQRRLIKMAADEHELVEALARSPGLPGTAIERHVHAVEHEPPRLAVKIDDPFGPQQVLALRLNERIEPAGEKPCIHGATLADRHTADVRVMLVRAVGEQLRIKLQGIPEIESAHAKHVLQIDAAIPGRVNTRQRIE